MLIDTHCHINMMVKKTFDAPLTTTNIAQAQEIVDDAYNNNVTRIINVGTSLVESKNCIALAQAYSNIVATVGLHPNDCTTSWRKDFDEIIKMVQSKETNKIVGIGECGIDKHYPGYNLQRQKDAFKAQIELALEHDLALVVHTRDAADETLYALQEFKNDPLRGTIHCFSEDVDYAREMISLGFILGLGGTITYPKNNHLREVATTVELTDIILETDAPFLPPQIVRGRKNHPKNIAIIAQYLAELRGVDVATISQVTTESVQRIFKFALS